MATDSVELENLEEKDSGSSKKKHKRQKRTVQPIDTDGILENGDALQTDSAPSQSSKRAEKKKRREPKLTTATDSPRNDWNPPMESKEEVFTPIRAIQSNGSDRSDPRKYQKIELTTLTDEEDEKYPEDQRENNQTLHHTTTDQRTASPMTQSFTSGENDAVEIHEFSPGDIDAYVEIYFDTLNNRLRHFIGDNEQLDEFRKAMKTRLSTDRNSREYQDVLIGKINGEVVSAVTLAFPGETATIPNESLLPQSTSCLTPLRRWMCRHANYTPTNMEECYIEMIGVKKAFQNHGIGAAMLECVEHFARQAGARGLTIHTNDDRLRNYFQRFGFNLDHSDSSGIWKWLVERQNTHKMSKIIASEGENPDTYPSYVNQSSVIDSETE